MFDNLKKDQHRECKKFVMEEKSGLLSYSFCLPANTLESALERVLLGPLCVSAEYKFCSRSLNFVKQLGSFEDKGDKWNAFLLIYCHLQITEGLRTKWCVRCKPLPINCNVLPNQGVVSSNINDFVCNFFLLCNGCSSVDLFDEQFWVVCTQADIKPYYRFCF